MTLWPSWLRRRPAKPLGVARAGSNPAGVVYNKLFIIIYYIFYVLVAQRIRRVTTNHEIAGSNPAEDVYIYFLYINHIGLIV